MSKARLVITAVTVEKRPVSEVVRSYGVARSWVYALLARYREEGEAAFEPRSRRTKSSPRAIPDAAAVLITEVRKDLAGRGLDAGPQTIAWHLAHHHGIGVSAATVSRYLARAGLVTPDRASGHDRLTCGSRPSCRTSAGNPISPTTGWPAGMDTEILACR
jgi:transposase